MNDNLLQVLTVSKACMSYHLVNKQTRMIHSFRIPLINFLCLLAQCIFVRGIKSMPCLQMSVAVQQRHTITCSIPTSVYALQTWFRFANYFYFFLFSNRKNSTFFTRIKE